MSRPKRTPEPEPTPTWGEIGSLLEREDPELYRRLRERDAAMRAQNRRRPHKPTGGGADGV